MTGVRFTLAESHVIAFPGSLSLLFGVYPPIFRSGEQVFRGDIDNDAVVTRHIQSKDWLKREAKEGRVMLLDRPVTVDTKAIVLCLPEPLVAYFPPGVHFTPVRKGAIFATVLEVSKAHTMLWNAIRRASESTERANHVVELRAFLIMCHYSMGFTSWQYLLKDAERHLKPEMHRKLHDLLRVNASHFDLPPPVLGH